ncbi:MAG: HEPN domain-containing protein [Pyrinomonadaceae bacterium]
MKPITSEWVKKAEADFNTTEREFAVKVDPNYDAVCFHSQQAAEKFLKARLQEAEIAFARIHDLTVLLDNVVTIEPAWEILRPQLHSLTAYAVEYRYLVSHRRSLRPKKLSKFVRSFARQSELR